VDPVTLVFERLVPASAELTWRALSNTDAFNRVAGLGFAFEEVGQPDGTVLRRGKVSRFGMTIAWDERPFEFVAPDRFQSERIMDSGPIARVCTRFGITEGPQGTTVRYEVDLYARHWLLRPIVAAEARVGTQPQLARALDVLVDAVRTDAPTFDPPPPLPAPAALELRARLAPLVHRVVADALDALITQGPLAAQDRIRPLRLAEQTGRPVGEVLQACLDAVASRALEARFLLLCPSCLGAKEELATLDPTGRRLHCTTCGISWEGSLADQVEVNFRPSPEVRSFEVPVDCMQSPSRTPHVRMQAPLPVGEVLDARVQLAAGCYRVEATSIRGAAHIEVVPRGDSRITLDLTENGMSPRRVEVGEGPVQLVVRGRVDREVTVSISERRRPPHALTLGAFLDHPGGVRWAMANPDLAIVPRQGAILVVLTEPSWASDRDPQLVQALRAVLVERGLDPLHEVDGRLIAFTPEIEVALAAAESAGGHGRVVGLAWGRSIGLRGPGGEVLLGPAVDAALAAARQVGWGRIAVDPASSEQAILLSALARLGPRVERIDPWGPRPALLHFSQPMGQVPARSGARPKLSGRVGPFELGEPIGQGSMGTVFEATDSRDGTPLVVKLLRDELSRDYRYAAAFHTEARVGWTVSHPRVARVVDWGLDPRHRVLYLAMERLQGITLEEHLKTHGALGHDALIQLSRDLLDALTAIHDAGVLHRDLKPSNVMLEPDGATILDFGIALPLGVGDVERAGTPSWLSPEQARGGELDERSDVYQLALLLVKAGTGHWPFPGRRASDRLAWRDQNELESLPHGLPDAFEPALLKALARTPAERPASARALRVALGLG
jgi:hypothetical protein